jgi:hypothetical protein
LKGGGDDREIGSLGCMLAAFVAWSAFAHAPPEGTPRRITGSVERLDGQIVTVARPDGGNVTINLAPDARIVGVEKRTVADIKPGDYNRLGGGAAPTARSTRLNCVFLPRRCAAAARSSARGPPGPRGAPSLLKPGAAILTVAPKKPDDSPVSTRLTVEKNGVKPPL